MSSSPFERFGGGARFRIEQPLGEGAFGIVYRAFDRQRGHEVALKALRRSTPDAIYRIKREFRSLADLSHRNLISLYDLLGVGDEWFFTMELIEGGRDFLQSLRRDTPAAPAPPRPEIRSADSTISAPWEEQTTVGAPPVEIWTADRLSVLRRLVAQLVEGLCALHGAGKLHRDIKPSNVIVTREGRVVLLDFGLVTDLDLSNVRSNVAGTPAYMSPEQCEALPLTEASDWYSTGVMLYQVLTGHLPFGGAWPLILRRKISDEPRPIRDRAAGVPRDLENLCLRLLRPEPSERPGAAEILSVVEEPAAAVRPKHVRPPPLQPLFIGRKEQLEVLHDALAGCRNGHLAAVFVSGVSGVGKTALVQHFLDAFREDPETLVLAGRCYERESVPYKAIDSLVDSLSRFLRQMPRDEVEMYLSRDISLLARLFPVLHRISAVAGAPSRPDEFPDSLELRRRAFTALKELLARLTARKNVILFIDDLHWGDVDSGLLLRKLFTVQDPPNLLLIGAYRSEDHDRSAILKTLSRIESTDTVRVERLELDPLPPADAVELARAMIGGDGDRAEAIAQDAAGNPLFICALIDYSRRSEGSPEVGSLEDLIRFQLSRLSSEARLLVEVIAVAGRPLDAHVAFEAAGVQPATQLLSILRTENLIRHRPSSEREQVEIFHDRVRSTILERMDGDALKAIHRDLASALERADGVDPEALAHHYLGAGERQLAARHSAAAAARAFDALAFERAVSLYRLAIEITDASDESLAALYQKLGDALANAGRGAEAADAYLKGVPYGGIEVFLELHRKAAEQLLRCGHFDRGLDTLRIVLGRLGMPLARTGKGALLALLYRRLRLRVRGLQFRERALSDISADDILRIDTCWPVAVGLVTVDTIRGADFQTRHLLLALQAGEPYRIVRALAMEVAYSSASGGRDRERTQAVSQMTMALAKRINHPHAIGLAGLTSGMGAFCEGRWRKAYELCSEAEKVFRERCTGVSWERDNAQIFSLGALFFLGEIRELSRRLPSLIREAEDRGDLYAQANLRIGFGFFSHMVWLAADDPEGAERELEAALSAWSLKTYSLQHYWARGTLVDIALYRGDDMTATARIPKRWRRMSRSFARHIQINMLVALFSRGRRLIAAAQTAADPDPFLNAALRDASRIEGERMAWSDPWAAMIRAAVAAYRGDGPQALTFLAAAESGLETQDMGLYAAVVRRRRGLLLAAGGKELVAAAEAKLQQEAIRRPDRIEAVLLPGPWISPRTAEE